MINFICEFHYLNQFLVVGGHLAQLCMRCLLAIPHFTLMILSQHAERLIFNEFMFCLYCLLAFDSSSSMSWDSNIFKILQFVFDMATEEALSYFSLGHCDVSF